MMETDDEQFDREWAILRAEAIDDAKKNDSVPLDVLEIILDDMRPFCRMLFDGKAPWLVVFGLCWRQYQTMTAQIMEVERDAGDATKH
jgi:hypothetical protein